METAVDRPPSSRATDYQGATVEITLPGRPESATHSVNNDSSTQDEVRTTGVASHFSEHHLVDAPAHNTNSTSDLPTDRAAGPSMIEPDDRELRHSLTTDSEAMPTEPVSSCGTSLSGEVKGTWVGNLKRDHMTLQLDISLDGLKFGLHNLTLSVSPEPLSPLDLGASLNDRPRPVTELHWTHATSAAEISMNRINQFEETQERQGNWDARTDSSQSIMTDGSRPSTTSVLSELPLVPIPELLHTPTRPSIPYASPLPTARLHPPAQSVEHRHLASNIPDPLDSEPVLVQIKEGEREVRTIRNAFWNLAKEWQNPVMMPDGVSLHDVEDRCTALDDALFDLSPIILLTWPPMRQASLGTDGGQPPAREQQWHLEHMGETERKWYLKQHEYTTSLQRNLTRLTLLARRVCEDPNSAYRGRYNAMERISQFTIKFKVIALRLKLADHVRCEQRHLSRVRHGTRRRLTDRSREQAAALIYHKVRLTQVLEEIEKIKDEICRLG
ncbi:hypothetical protein F5148DRAFT_151651 [Russula earlei]|uniref:Uncharacterized protein n=1 Tax=Russula earlei TaxID=71964 RepID=A0ACC0U8C7_9AGAM|nr:hypothetical protein F5148DRAFT_151651 [Russula earlei]